MEHIQFLILNFAVFLAIVFYDRKRWKAYVSLGLLAMLLDLIFEIVPIYAGIWQYHSQPMIFGLSLYVWLLYIPYLGFCYFAANRARKHV